MNDNNRQSSTAALFEALRPSSPQEQLDRLREFNKRIEQGEFALRRHAK